MEYEARSPILAVSSAGSTVVDLPDDIDTVNARAVCDGLVTLLDGGVSSLVMDMTGTRFCDCAGIRGIVLAGQHAEALHTPVCVALPVDGPVRRVAELMRLSRRLQVATGRAAAERWIEEVPVPADA